MIQVAPMACAGLCLVWVAGLPAQQSVRCAQTSPAHAGIEVPQEPERDSDTGGEPSWWSLAFQEGKWDLALGKLVNTPMADRPAAYAILLNYIKQEIVPAPEKQVGSPWDLKRTQSALSWADWYLRVAPGRAGGIKPGELDAVRQYILKICPDPKNPFWTGFNAAALELFEITLEGAPNPLAVLLDVGLPGWTMLEKGALPQNLKSGRFVAFKDNYKIKEHIRLHSGAELWVERGTTITIDARKNPDDVALELNGHFRVFGERNEPVKIVIKYVNRERQENFTLFRSAGFQYFTDLAFELAAKGSKSKRVSTCTAIEGKPLNAWIQHCSIDGKRSELGHSGIVAVKGRIIMSDCELISLRAAYAATGVSLLSYRNTFTKNKYAHKAWYGEGQAYHLNVEYDSNEYDLFWSGHASHKHIFVFRYCKLTSDLTLATHSNHNYDLNNNYWKKGPKRQIVNYSSGGASRAQFDEILKKEIKGIGARKRRYDR
ncbi:MAG: hypothetical protein ABGY32_01035 [bacterium]